MVVDGEGAGVGSARQISSAETDRKPTWSPDGTQFAFVIVDRLVSSVFTMDVNGRARSRLRLSSPGDEPAWSPDGRSIALTVINPKQHGAREGVGLAPDFCTRYSESLTALDPDAFDLFPPWSRPARNGLEIRSA